MDHGLAENARRPGDLVVISAFPVCRAGHGSLRQGRHPGPFRWRAIDPASEDAAAGYAWAADFQLPGLDSSEILLCFYQAPI